VRVRARLLEFRRRRFAVVLVPTWIAGKRGGLRLVRSGVLLGRDELAIVHCVCERHLFGVGWSNVMHAVRRWILVERGRVLVSFLRIGLLL